MVFAPVLLVLAGLATLWFSDQVAQATLKFVWLFVAGVCFTMSVVEALRLALNRQAVLDYFTGKSSGG